MLRSSRTRLSKMGSLSGAVALIVGAIVSVFGLVAGPLAVSASAATTGASNYTAVTPFRVSGTTAAGVALATGATESVQITGAGTPAVPTSATAVVLNVTAQNPTAAGYLTLYPTGGTQPSTSNVNFVAGQTVANLVTVPLSAAGAVTVFNFTGTTNVDLDVEGYYTPTTAATGTGLYNPVTPDRVFGGAALGTPIGAGVTTSATVTGGTTGVPTTASAVVVNLTAAGGTAASYLTAYPAGATPNVTSNLNFVAGQTIANRDIVDVGTSGQIDLFNFAGSVNVDVDVEGYYTGAGGAGSAFVPLASPVRVTDTRAGTNGSPIASGGTETIALDTTASGIPATATAVAANFTVVPGAAPGYITVYPTGAATVPTASDVNWAPGEGPVANFTQADTAGTTGGSVAVYNFNSGSTINLVIDAFGYFAPTGSTASTANTVNIAIPSTTVNSITVPAVLADVRTITATVNDGTGGPLVSSDPVLFSVTPTTGCGTFVTATTGPQTDTVTTALPTVGTGTATISYYPPAYVAGTTASVCTITAKDGDYGQTGSAIVDQTEPPNTLATTGNGNLPANGAANETLSTAVTPGVTGEAISDTVTYTLAGDCGSIASVSGSTGTAGTTPVTTVYTAGTAPGFCFVTTSEANSGATTTVVIDQTQSPTPAAGAVHITGTGVGGTVTAPTASQTVGAAVTYTATALDSTTAIVPNDPVLFSVVVPLADVGDTCGTVSPAAGVTGSSGIATFTYTAAAPSATASPLCDVFVTEADSGATTPLAVTQTGLPSVVTLTPASNNDPLGTADSVAVSVSNVAAVDNNDAIVYTVTAAPGSTSACQAAPANGSLVVAAGSSTGTATTSYTSPSNSGFCVLKATLTTSTNGSVNGQTTIDQT
jgi:hypothetical protein